MLYNESKHHNILALLLKANKHQSEKKITVLKASKWNKIESTLIKIENSETPNSNRSQNKRQIQTQKKKKKRRTSNIPAKNPQRKKIVFSLFFGKAKLHTISLSKKKFSEFLESVYP
jgi:hypothetical protein